MRFMASSIQVYDGSHLERPGKELFIITNKHFSHKLVINRFWLTNFITNLTQ